MPVTDRSICAIIETVKHPGLLNDILFKIVFGTQQSEPVLRALLNALLSLEGPQTIASLEILNPGFDKEFLVEKGPRACQSFRL